MRLGIALLILFIPTVRLQPATVPSGLERRLNLSVPMQDGIRLSTHVFRPLNAGALPTILIRTPYGKGPDLLPAYLPFIERNYNLVIQDVRGRYASEGEFRPVTQETSDGNDTLNWIARQSWSNGKVGMMGGSYVGINAWRAALSGNPHLKAISTVVSGDDEYLDRFYSRGGAMKLGHRLLWLAENLRLPGYRADFKSFVRHLPLRSADRAATGQTLKLFQDAVEHPAYDDYWKRLSTRFRLSDIKIPVLTVAGWYDNYAESDLEAFATRQKLTPNHRIVVGPWPHNMSVQFPNVDFGPDSGAPVKRYQLDFFDTYLKAKPAPAYAAPVHLFVMGANQWRDEQEWPLTRAKPTAFYLQSTGFANTLNGTGILAATPSAQEPPDQYVYDPRNPTPTVGGAVCCNPSVFPWGPQEQRPVERRPDVLVYSSPVLKHEVEVTGPIQVVLHVSTTARDTDFTAKLVDVFPDGTARNLTDGILRLRYRNGLQQSMLAEPGRIYPITIETGVTSNVFRAGHRMRIEISSSNFPRFDRNLNTGRPNADETKSQIARQTVYHDRVHPSYVLLPIVPAAPARLTPTHISGYVHKSQP